MFSGIVETLGRVLKAKEEGGCLQITVRPLIEFTDLIIGDSLAINGVCLTITEIENNNFSATIVPETLRLTNLGELKEGTWVNLERSLKADGRNGGHHVQGHVDAIGEILEINKDGQQAILLKISIPATSSRYVVSKGYITIDGMSITVIEAEATYFTVTLIPHTLGVTRSKDYQIGTRVNLEVDILGKYVEKLMRVKNNECTH